MNQDTTVATTSTSPLLCAVCSADKAEYTSASDACLGNRWDWGLTMRIITWGTIRQVKRMDMTQTDTIAPYRLLDLQAPAEPPGRATMHLCLTDSLEKSITQNTNKIERELYKLLNIGLSLSTMREKDLRKM